MMLAFELFNNTRDAYRMEEMDKKKKQKDKGDNPYQTMRRQMGLPD
jgi:hypothetical protein